MGGRREGEERGVRRGGGFVGWLESEQVKARVKRRERRERSRKRKKKKVLT